MQNIPTVARALLLDLVCGVAAMPLLGKEVLAAYVSSTLVTRNSITRRLGRSCQLPQFSCMLSRNYADPRFVLDLAKR